MAETNSKPTDVLSGKAGGNAASQTTPTQTAQAEEQKPKKVVTTTDDPSALYCDAMNEQNINQVADGKTLVRVVLVGFEEYGKSTFVSSLYYCFFNNEMFCDQVMCDSETYSGFEKRLLVRSMKTKPELKTKRTIKGENPLLVMTLESEATGRYKLVVSDRSGEDYSGFSGSGEEIKDNQILKVADHVVFFLDSEKMTENFSKLRYSYRNFLQELVNQNILADGAEIALAFNKYDKSKAHADYASRKASVEAFFKEVLGDRTYKIYEMDSTGVSDNFASVGKLTKDLLLGDETKADEKKRQIDWVKNELND